jgi:hypothetical protein
VWDLSKRGFDSQAMTPRHNRSPGDTNMRYLTVLLVTLSMAALAQPASAKSNWDQLADTAPRVEPPFEQVEMTAPRSAIFTDIDKTAPRSGAFDELSKTAP